MKVVLGTRCEGGATMSDSIASIHNGFTHATGGRILDPFGHELLLFGVQEFNDWWNQFESFFASPIGRKLIYAATDEEEYSLGKHPYIQPKKWFSKKKSYSALLQRWRAMGWGVYDLESDSILSPAHPTLTVGFALAAKEHFVQKRFRLEWDQRSSDYISIDFSEKNEPMSDVHQAPLLNWGEETTLSHGKEELNHEIQLRSFGFFIGQQRGLFVPSQVLNRLYFGLQGRPLRDARSVQQDMEVEGLEQSIMPLFQASVAASKFMFESSNYGLFVQQESDWNDHVELRLSQRGFGVLSEQGCSLSSTNSLEATLHSPHPGYSLGLIWGMWERAHGSPFRMKVEIGIDALIFSLYPRQMDYET